MVAPLSGKLQQKMQLDKQKAQADEQRKQELQEIKLQEAEAKANMALQFKTRDQIIKEKQKLADSGLNSPVPPLNPVPAPQGMGYEMPDTGDDQIAAVKTGEAIIPVEAAQDPKNKPMIAAMVNQGREAQGYARGTMSIPKPNKSRTGLVDPEQMLPTIPIVGSRRKLKGYQFGSTSISSLEDYDPNVWKDISAGTQPTPTEAPTSLFDRAVSSFGNAVSNNPLIQALVPQPNTKAPLVVESIRYPQQPITFAGVQQPDETQNTNNPTVPIPATGVPLAVPTAQEGGTPAIPTPTVQSSVSSRHNNPGNLKFVGQEGAVPGEKASDGGSFAQFETPEAGQAALERDIGIKVGREKTVRKIVSRYAPVSSNNTEAYINDVATQLGIDPDTDVPPEKQAALVAAIARHESGNGASSPRGVPPLTKQVKQVLPEAPVELTYQQALANHPFTSEGMPGSENLQAYRDELKSTVPQVTDLITKHGSDKDSFLGAFRNMFSYRGAKDLLGLNDNDIARLGAGVLVGVARGYSVSDSLGYAGKMVAQTSLQRQAQEAQDERYAMSQVSQEKSRANSTAMQLHQNDIRDVKYRNQVGRAEQQAIVRDEVQRADSVRRDDLIQRKAEDASRASTYNTELNRFQTNLKNIPPQVAAEANRLASQGGGTIASLGQANQFIAQQTTGSSLPEASVMQPNGVSTTATVWQGKYYDKATFQPLPPGTVPSANYRERLDAIKSAGKASAFNKEWLGTDKKPIPQARIDSLMDDAATVMAARYGAISADEAGRVMSAAVHNLQTTGRPLNKDNIELSMLAQYMNNSKEGSVLGNTISDVKFAGPKLKFKEEPSTFEESLRTTEAIKGIAKTQGAKEDTVMHSIAAQWSRLGDDVKDAVRGDSSGHNAPLYYYTHPEKHDIWKRKQKR